MQNFAHFGRYESYSTYANVEVREILGLLVKKHSILNSNFVFVDIQA